MWTALPQRWISRIYFGRAGVRATELDRDVQATVSAFQLERLTDRDIASNFGLHPTFLPGMRTPTCQPKNVPA